MSGPGTCSHAFNSPPIRAVGGILDNLHGIAVDMGSELDRQNDQLGRINQKAEVNEAHLGAANYRMRQQL